MPWDAILFASSAVKESVTTSIREGAGLPFADRHRAVRRWPASAHVTTAGSPAAAACGDVEAGIGISRGRPGTGVVIKSSNPSVRGADRRLTFAAGHCPSGEPAQGFGMVMGHGTRLKWRTLPFDVPSQDTGGSWHPSAVRPWLRIPEPGTLCYCELLLRDVTALCYCAMRARTISLTALPSKRPATLAVTGFITAPSWRMVSSVPPAVRSPITSSTIASTSAAVSAFGR